jgi:serine/threonine protein kinase
MHISFCVLTRAKVALKEIRTTHGSDRNEMNKAWEQEANTLRLVNTLNHRHLIKCLAAIRRGDRRFFMFPWADGGTLREIWDRIPQPNLRPELVLDCMQQLRGLADALVHMHNYEPKVPEEAKNMTFAGDGNVDSEAGQSELSIRHGDLKPENILSFTTSTSELGLLKIADLAIAKQHLVATELRQDTSTRFSTVRYEAPETTTERYGRSRLYDIWSIGCITLEMIIWLLYGSEGLRAFYDDFRIETPESLSFYEASTSPERSSATIHRVVTKWIDFIERSDPECMENSAIRALLIIVRDRLLVVALPLHNMASARKDQALAKADIPSHADIPSITISPAVTIESGATLSPYRATAREFRDLLDDCLTMNDVSSRYWLTRPDRTNVRRPPRSESVPDISKSSTASAHLEYSEYRSEPARLESTIGSNKRWEIIVDNTFARKVLDSLGSRILDPRTGAKKQLCDICEKLDFFAADFAYEWSHLDVTLRAHACAFCQMLVKIKPRGERDTYLLERSHSNLFLASYEIPAFTILSSPELEATFEMQLGFPEIPETDDETFYSILRLWLEDCDQNHPECHRALNGRLPTRLIDVGSRFNGQLRLVETEVLDDTSSRYTALSYPWDNPAKMSYRAVTRGNYADFLQAIDIRSLPATFRDAVECTRALGLRYLWIDALCIIEGEHGDYDEQAQTMGDVFSGAYCVLAASRAVDQGHGFIKPRVKRDYVQFWRNKAESFYVSEFIDGFETDILSQKLHQTGVKLQELAITQRTIYFSERQNYFECSQGIYCETLTRLHRYAAHFENRSLAQKLTQNFAVAQLTYLVMPDFCTSCCRERLKQRSYRISNGSTEFIQDSISTASNTDPQP